MKHRITLAFLTLTLICGLVFSAPALAFKNGFTDPSFSTIPATSFFKRFFGDNEEEPAAPVEDVDLREKHKAAFEENSKVYSAQRFERSPVTYKFNMPEDWRHTTKDIGLNISLNTSFLTVLDHFQGELLVGGGRSGYFVDAINLDHEILAEHWLQDYIFKNGHTSEEPIQSSNENQASAEYIFIKSGVSYLAFVKVYIVRNRVIMVKFETPISTDEQEIAFGKLAVDSFHITSSDIGTIEDTNEFSFLNALRFTYPESWVARNHLNRPPNHASIDFQNRSENQVLNGLVRVKTYRHGLDQDIPSIVEELRGSVEKDLQLKVNQLTHSTSLSIGVAFDIAHIERYDVSQKNSLVPEYEIWLTTLATDEWTTFIYLLTPNQRIDFYNWARNTRMLDLLLDSLN